MDHQDREREDTAVNGFGRLSLHVTEARAIWDARYPVPLYMRYLGG
jgi:hypothetical protein